MLCAIAIAVVSVALARLSVQCYDFFDMSAFMDAGWRMACGQRPYTDFIYNAGPVHPALWALFFLIFGFGGTAIIAYLAVSTGVVMACTYAIVRSRFDRLLATLLSAAAGYVFYAAPAHPWYDQTAGLFVVVAMTVVLLCQADVRRRAIRVGVVAGLLLAGAFLSKANVGVAGGAMIGAMLLCLPRRKIVWALGACFAGGVVGLGLIFLLTRSDPMLFLDQTLLAYNASGRMDRMRFFTQVFRDPIIRYPLIFAAAAAIFAIVRGVPGRALAIVASFGLIFVQAFGILTGSMVIFANFMLVGVLAATATLLLAPRKPKRSWERAIPYAALLLAVVVTFFAYDRRLSTWDWFPHNRRASYEIQAAPLRGWHTYPEVGVGLDAAVRYIDNHVPRNESLWVMPTATVIYGLTNRESLAGQSFIYDLGTFPPPGAALDATTQSFLAAPPDWILIHRMNFNTLAPSEELLDWMKIGEIVKRDYDSVWAEGGFEMLKRRSPTRK